MEEGLWKVISRRAPSFGRVNIGESPVEVELPGAETPWLCCQELPPAVVCLVVWAQFFSYPPPNQLQCTARRPRRALQLVCGEWLKN